jgi:hypothetical protein
LGAEISLRTFFEKATVRGLAAQVAAKRQENVSGGAGKVEQLVSRIERLSPDELRELFEGAQPVQQ